MIFTETDIPGAWVIDIEPIEDNRGLFARWYCAKEFVNHGLKEVTVQGNMSVTNKKGTVRGIHLQRPPADEAKLVRCSGGAIFDVIVDCRPDSPTFLQWFGIGLSSSTFRAVYVPEGCAHGYQSLTDNAEVSYMVSEPYTPNSGLGIRPDDPELAVKWPVPISVVSDQDKSWPLLSETDHQTFGG